MNYFIANETDIPFIAQTYIQNIESLHGNQRTYDDWKRLLSDSTYYVVRTTVPVAWFRTDVTDNILWLGMLQVKPEFQRQGIGKYILSVIEDIARTKSIKKIGIHTTDDNFPAKNLYLSAEYTITEHGPCTTADGVKRTGYTFIKKL